MLRTIPEPIAPEAEGARVDSVDGHGLATPLEAPVAAGDLPLRRREIHEPADYGVTLPPWLQECVRHVPPGTGDSCPTDTEALLASAFDFAFQLHEGQFRATGET